MRSLAGLAPLAALVAAALPQVGCLSGGEEEVGTVQIAITQVPADVRCIRVTATGSRTVTRLFDVTPGMSSVLQMSGIPVGSVEFVGDAFAESCPAVIAASVPNWSSAPVVADVSSRAIVSVALVMHRNGRASVSIDFQDDGSMCVPDNAMCDPAQTIPCCAGTPCPPTRVCGQPMCIPDGIRCDPTNPASRCCSTGVCPADGICGPQMCLPDGAACDPTNPASRCCSTGVCPANGICGPQMCLPDGAFCNPADPNRRCCTNGLCPATGRCGPQMCIPDNVTCNPTDPTQRCCSTGGPCPANGICGPQMCLPDGAACDPANPNSRCCSTGICPANGICGSQMCRPAGAPCGGTAFCCSGLMCDPTGICRPPMQTCNDGVQDGTESDVDCGGGLCQQCLNGRMCRVPNDCQSTFCVFDAMGQGRCQPSPAQTCNDNVRNGNETDVDCGGSCPPCAPGQRCGVDSDCLNSVCLPLLNICG